jgi:hypothetical protein
MSLFECDDELTEYLMVRSGNSLYESNMSEGLRYLYDFQQSVVTGISDFCKGLQSCVRKLKHEFNLEMH